MGLINKKEKGSNTSQTKVNKEVAESVKVREYKLLSTLKKIIKSRLGIKIVGAVFVLVVITGIILKIMNVDLSSSIFNSAKNAIVGKGGTVTTISEASLEKVFEISELSTADYAYNAIASAYENDGKTAKYYVAYDGTVTAGIDFSKIIIAIDDDSKKITLTIPNCEIQDTTVDFGSMKYIFENDKYDTETVSQEAYELCKADLVQRVEKEEDLLVLAKENATAAVEALVNPWVKQIDSEYVVDIQ